MSELQPTPQELFINDVRAAIASDMTQFERLAETAGVQEFCNYDSRFGRELDYSNAASFMEDLKADPEPREFAPQEVAECLGHANARLDDFVNGLVLSYCNRKKQPLPTDEESENAVLAKVLTGGYGKVNEYMIWSRNNDSSEPEGIDTTEQKAFLPLTFMMLGARLKSSAYYDNIRDVLEPNVSQEEIDTQLDEAMRTACLAIQQNKKATLPKTATEAEKAFAAAMNCLRTSYNMHEDRGFKEQLLILYGQNFGTKDAKTIEDFHASYDAFRSYFADLIGARYTAYGPQQATNIMHLAHKKGIPLFDNQKRLIGAINTTIDQLVSIRSTHSLVDSIANGTLTYSQIKQAQMLLNKQPLARPVADAVEMQMGLDEWVDWEILPPGLLEDTEGAPRLDDGQRDPYDHQRQIDWKRLWRLQNYAKGWSGAYFARTSIPNLPLDQQYYAVILPDTINGQEVEHAVADHPETGNGMYVWRAEMGIDQGATRLTWREVMARPRMTARELGARCLYHTVNLETNLLAYLTDPKPERRRYTRQ